MLEYREIAPPQQLAGLVECFWTGRADGEIVHRVLPDGCADILLTCTGGHATLEAVGPMTRYADHPVLPGQHGFGIRFRPGQWSGVLEVPGDRIVDSVLPLEDLWGSRAKWLLEQLANARSTQECARIVQAALPEVRAAGPVERAVQMLERAGGCSSIDELAGHAGLSPRQFRRLCLEKTGLPPKFLARILRFRAAAAKLDSCVSAADLALDCGYYDQAHLINEFREFAGRTPGARSE